MSFRSKQELLQQIAPRYQEATETQKVAILNEFVAAAGYARKYAIRVLSSTLYNLGKDRRHRAISEVR